MRGQSQGRQPAPLRPHFPPPPIALPLLAKLREPSAASRPPPQAVPPTCSFWISLALASTEPRSFFRSGSSFFRSEPTTWTWLSRSPMRPVVCCSRGRGRGSAAGTEGGDQQATSRSAAGGMEAPIGWPMNQSLPPLPWTWTKHRRQGPGDKQSRRLLLPMLEPPSLLLPASR